MVAKGYELQKKSNSWQKPKFLTSVNSVRVLCGPCHTTTVVFLVLSVSVFPTDFKYCRFNRSILTSVSFQFSFIFPFWFQFCLQIFTFLSLAIFTLANESRTQWRRHDLGQRRTCHCVKSFLNILKLLQLGHVGTLLSSEQERGWQTAHSPWQGLQLGTTCLLNYETPHLGLFLSRLKTYLYNNHFNNIL